MLVEHVLQGCTQVCKLSVALCDSLGVVGIGGGECCFQTGHAGCVGLEVCVERGKDIIKVALGLLSILCQAYVGRLQARVHGLGAVDSVGIHTETRWRRTHSSYCCRNVAMSNSLPSSLGAAPCGALGVVERLGATDGILSLAQH